jgi:hypothetical protein
MPDLQAGDGAPSGPDASLVDVLAIANLGQSMLAALSLRARRHLRLCCKSLRVEVGSVCIQSKVLNFWMTCLRFGAHLQVDRYVEELELDLPCLVEEEQILSRRLARTLLRPRTLRLQAGKWGRDVGGSLFSWDLKAHLENVKHVDARTLPLSRDLISVGGPILETPAMQLTQGALA